MALFGIAFALVIGALYLSTVRLIEHQTAATVAAELNGLADRYRDEGLAGLANSVLRRVGDADPDAVYLLARPDGVPITGNLTSWPDGAVSDGTWVRLELFRESSGAAPHTVGTRSFRLPTGHLLLVGRDFSAQQDFRRNLLAIFLAALTLTVALGIAGGMLMSRNLLRRIDAVSEAGRRIMAGDLAERLPTDRSGDEFDRLAGGLNRMLARIEELLLGMRVVSESMSHDLRSPLTRLRNRAELASRDAGCDADAALRDALAQTVADTDSVLATFNALTEIAQAEAGTARHEMALLDLARLVRDAGELYAPLAEDKGIRFDVDAAEAVTVRGHGQLLSQAVANLIDNAIKYTPAGGAVEVAVGSDPGGARLTVADSGPGVPAADRDRVLERFVRLDVSRSAPGSGLGLSLVAAVVRLHDGRMTLDDARPGAAMPGLRVVWEFPSAVRDPNQ
jgi:signal transduction histidine kinase